MKKASLIIIGNELLSGQTIDTNSAYLGQRLMCLGVPVVKKHIVPDEVDAIEQALVLAAQEADIILVTGGLGPTDDDVSRHGLAKFLGVDLKLHEDLIDDIRARFSAASKEMPDSNLIQAYIPDSAEPIKNEFGTAAGIKAYFQDKACFLMPGVPMELHQMFERSVVDLLKQIIGDQAVEIRKLRCFGIGESALAVMLGDKMQRDRNPLINCTVSCGVLTLHIIGQSQCADQALKMVLDEQEQLNNMLGSLVFGTEDETLAEVVGKDLIRNNQTLALAESCTGGLIGKYITDCPGASKFFKQGWITYSNEAKIEQLDVSAELINRYGAVSKQVAQAMAMGARRKSNTNYSIAVTGIAGPEGGTKEKPVGLVFIGIDSDLGCKVKQCSFSRDREFIRQRAAQTALHELWKRLNFDLSH